MYSSLLDMLLMEATLTRVLDSSRLYYHAYGLVYWVSYFKLESALRRSTLTNSLFLTPALS